MENCPHCNGEMETSGPYARCANCDCLYVDINGSLHEYPVIEPMRRLIERVLGFSPLEAEPAPRKEE